MLCYFVFFWLLSSPSYGHQPPPVDRGTNNHQPVGLVPSTSHRSANSNSNNNSTFPLQHPRLQVFRGPGQSQSANLPYDQTHSPINEHDHNDHDEHHHKGHKLSKLNIQHYITQKDIEKLHSKDPIWKRYFAELLAASILIGGVIGFLCWWNWSKRGRQIDRSAHPFGTAATHSHGKRLHRLHRQNTFNRGQSMPDLYVNVCKAVPLPKNPKSGCVCSPEEANNAKRRWSHKDLESCSSVIPSNV